MDWTLEALTREIVNEGYERWMYRDSLGNRTIGIGFNLERQDAMTVLAQAGVPPSMFPDIANGHGGLTNIQVIKLYALSWDPIVPQARASLDPGIFDALTDARRYVVADLDFNMGQTTWLAFIETRRLISRAQRAKQTGDLAAHSLFVQAGDHIKASQYYTQTGDRAKRNVAMLVEGIWCKADGNGSDIHKETHV